MLIIFDLDDTLYDRTGQVPENYTDEDISRIVPFPGVREFLSTSPGKKVLVTKETVSGLQNRKIDALGLRHHFEAIMICHSDQEKKDCFQQIISQFPNEEVWVVGDRVNSEIKYGKELGFKTVWLRHGNHAHQVPQEYGEIPDYELSVFSELSEILKR